MFSTDQLANVDFLDERYPEKRATLRCRWLALMNERRASVSDLIRSEPTGSAVAAFSLGADRREANLRCQGLRGCRLAAGRGLIAGANLNVRKLATTNGSSWRAVTRIRAREP